MPRGKIRVGSRLYSSLGPNDPTYPDFSPVVCLTKSSPYGSLGPYVLRTPDGVLLENLWQFSKVYRKTPSISQKVNRYTNELCWNYPETKFFDSNNLSTPNENYWTWRLEGMQNPHPVRWPVGKPYSKKCLYSIPDSDHDLRLGYVEARKAIYLKPYLEAVVKQKQFKELRTRVEEGENLLIIEVDGPHQESLDYYISEYGVEETFFEGSTVLATKRNLEILLNDPKHPFGHGYCLASALLGFGEKLVDG